MHKVDVEKLKSNPYISKIHVENDVVKSCSIKASVLGKILLQNWDNISKSLDVDESVKEDFHEGIIQLKNYSEEVIIDEEIEDYFIDFYPHHALFYLMMLFDWDNTPQGYIYWEEFYDMLVDEYEESFPSMFYLLSELFINKCYPDE